MYSEYRLAMESHTCFIAFSAKYIFLLIFMHLLGFVICPKAMPNNVLYALPPCIMPVQYPRVCVIHQGCEVRWRMFSTPGECHEYTRIERYLK